METIFFQITVLLTRKPKTTFHGFFTTHYGFQFFFLFLYLPINIGKINKNANYLKIRFKPVFYCDSVSSIFIGCQEFVF